jgi:hypothetical protein
MWQPFNENKPFGKGTVVSADNVAHSKTRWEATKAVRAGTATPEQTLLVHETDRIMQEALSLREE